MSRLTRLITFLALCLLLAACSAGASTSEVTTVNPETGEATSGTGDDIEVSTGSAEGGDEDEEDPSAPEAPVAPAAPEVTSPAARQDAQSVGGVVAEVDEAAESADASTTADADDAPAPSQGEQTAPAAAPIGPVVDIPVYPSSGGGSDIDNAQVQDAPASSAATSAAPVEDLSPGSCGSACEIGGVEPDAGIAADVLEPQVLPQEPVDPPSVAELASDLDDICPEGSAEGCVTDPVEVAIADDSIGSEEVVDELTCEIRPWMVGCDGPVPEPGDYEPQAIVQPENDGSAGVQVPQEIQDVLLAPIDE